MPELMLMPNNPLSHRPRHSTDIGRRIPQSHPRHPPVVRPPPARSTRAARPSPPVRASPALPPAGASGSQVHDGLSPTAVSVLSSQEGEIDISGGTFNAVKGNQNHVTVQVHVNGVGEGLTAAEPLCKASMPVKSERPQPSSPTFSPDASLDRKGSIHSLQPRSSQLMISEQSINDVYYRLLSSKKRGSPLWIPTTNEQLPVEYQRNGLGIGDVGVITDRGFFDSLFNITHPRDHPLAINSDRLPSEFDPLNIAPDDIQEYSEFEQGSHLSSPSIKNSYKDDDSSGLVFESSASEGAILTLPYGSNSKDLGNKKKLQDYLSVHGEEMYRCALNQHGRIIKNGDLRVITGYDKTTNWGMAAFSNSSDRTDTESFCLKFRPKDPGVGGRIHSWESSGSAVVKAGPDMRAIVALRRGDPSQQDIEYENQAVFIRTHNITLSKETWNKLLSNSGTGDIEIDKESSSHPSSSHSARPTGSSGSSSQSSSNSENHSSRSSGSRTTHSILSNTLTLHPSNGINEILLKFNPQARMAITGDECWISVLREDDLVLPPVKQLWARIEQSFVVREEDGVVSLERSIIQTSTLPTSISLMNTCLAIGSANTQLPADAVDSRSHSEAPVGLSPHARSLSDRSPVTLASAGTRLSPTAAVSVLSSQDGEIDVSGGTRPQVHSNNLLRSDMSDYTNNRRTRMACGTCRTRKLKCRPPKPNQSGVTGACERCIKKGLKDCQYFPVEQGSASHDYGPRGQIQDDSVPLYPVGHDPVANRPQYPPPNLPSSSSGGYTPNQPYYMQAPSSANQPLTYQYQQSYPGPQVPYSSGYPAQPNHQPHLPSDGYPPNMSYQQPPVYYDPRYYDDRYYKSAKE